MKETTTMTTNRGFAEQPYTRVLIPLEEGGYFGEILEFPGCITEGETPEDTLRNLNEAAEGWIEAALEQGQSVPEPSVGRGFNGRIALRVPRSLHRKAAILAERDGVSLNQYIVSAISMMVGADDMLSHFIGQFNKGAANTILLRLPVQAIQMQVMQHTRVAAPAAEIATLPSIFRARAANVEVTRG